MKRLLSALWNFACGKDEHREDSSIPRSIGYAFLGFTLCLGFWNRGHVVCYRAPASREKGAHLASQWQVVWWELPLPHLPGSPVKTREHDIWHLERPVSVALIAYLLEASQATPRHGFVEATCSGGIGQQGVSTAKEVGRSQVAWLLPPHEEQLTGCMCRRRTADSVYFRS